MHCLAPDCLVPGTRYVDTFPKPKKITNDSAALGTYLFLSVRNIKQASNPAQGRLDITAERWHCTSVPSKQHILSKASYFRYHHPCY